MLFALTCSGCFPSLPDSDGGTVGPQLPLHDIGAPSATGGNVIVFVSLESGNGDIHLFDSAANKVTALTADGAYDASPLISTDGNRVFFERYSGSTPHVWMISPCDPVARQITEGGQGDTLLDVSPDGTHIIVYRTSRWEGNSESVILKIGSEIETADRIESGRAECFVTNEEVLCSGDDGAIYRKRIGESEASRLCRGNLPILSPNRRRMLVVDEMFPDPGDRQWIVRTVAGESLGRMGAGYTPAFSSDGSRVIFSSPKLTHELFSYEIATKKTSKIGAPGYINELHGTPAGVLFHYFAQPAVVGTVDENAWTILPLNTPRSK